MFKPVKRKQECCSEYGIVPGYVTYIVFKLNDEAYAGVCYSTIILNAAVFIHRKYIQLILIHQIQELHVKE